MLVHLNFTVAPRLFRIVQGLITGIYLLGAPAPARPVSLLGLLLPGLTLQVVGCFLSRSRIYYRHRYYLRGRDASTSSA